MSGFPKASSQSTYKIGLAGCGKMGSAMLRAWISAKIVSQIHTLDPNGLPADLLTESKITHHTNDHSFLEAANPFDMLVLAIKPQTLGSFCLSIRDHLNSKLCILSIAAGQTIGGYQARFGSIQPIIRAMPNLPASIGKGMTVACASETVLPERLQCAHDLLSSFGLVEWTSDESKMDAVTAVSGSGPAYVFLLIEALIEAGVKAGLDKEFAQTLARQTVIGSAALVEATPRLTPTQLRDDVTSPKGTTAAALAILMKDGKFQELFDKAIAAATTRSKELSN